MNIKALITTLVVGSSSMALADTSSSISASANATWSLSVPAIRVEASTVRDHRDGPVTSRPLAQAPNWYRGDDREYDRRYDQPGWTDQVIDPRNTTVGASGSEYRGPVYSRPIHRDYYDSYRGNEGYRYRATWMPLTDPTRIDRGREFFSVGAQAGRFNTLMLQQLAGRSFIRQVAVQFANGETQVVRGLNSQLGRDNRDIVINLDGTNREISRVIVYGWTGPHSSYRLLVR